MTDQLDIVSWTLPVADQLDVVSQTLSIVIPRETLSVADQLLHHHDSTVCRAQAQPARGCARQASVVIKSAMPHQGCVTQQRQLNHTTAPVYTYTPSQQTPGTKCAISTLALANPIAYSALPSGCKQDAAAYL